MNSIHKIQHYFFAALISMMIIGQVPAQAQVDEKRMERDIRIMQKALNETLRQEMGWERPVIWGRDETKKPRYIPKVGIMLYALNKAARVRISPSEAPGSESEIEQVLTTFLADYGDLAQELPPYEHIMIQYNEGGDGNRMIFMEEDKRRGRVEEIAAAPNQEKGETLLVKVPKETVQKLRKGTISFADFEQAVEANWTENETENDREFKIFAQILKSLYEEERTPRSFSYFYSDEDCDGCETSESEKEPFFPDSYGFKSSWGDQVEFQRTQGLGVEYLLKLGYYLEGYNTAFSSNVRVIIQDGQVLQADERGPEGSEKLDEEKREYLRDRDEKIENLFESFVAEMQEAIILYGRTLRSLESEEFLIVLVEMPACFECELPADVEFKIQRKALNAYDEGKMELEEAIDAIQVAQKGKARELQDLPAMMMGRSTNYRLRGRGGSAISIESHPRKN